MALQAKSVTPGAQSLGGAASLPDAFGNYPSNVRSDTTQTKIQNASNLSFENKEKIGTRSQIVPLKFPLDQQDRFKGNMTFQAIKIIPPEISVSRYFAERITDIIKLENRSSEGTDQIDPSIQNEINRHKSKAESAQQQNVKVQSAKLEILDGQKVTMFIPTAFVVNDIIQYDTPELGAMGAAGLQALNRSGDIFSSVGQAVKTGVSGLKDLFAPAGSLSGDAARFAVATAASFIPSQTASNVLRSAAQVTMNPNVRAIFRSVAIREFTFQFKLIPNSARESDEIKKIIRFFRYHAYPESIERGGVPLVYNFPSMFKIKLQYNNVPFGTKIKMCYLRNISTTYNPTSASFHADGSPTEIDLTLSFVENKTLVRQDIDNFGSKNKQSETADGLQANILDVGDGF